MKTLHRLLLLVMVACAAQLAQAYEYFNIYFHDGTKSEPFFSASVDSIRYSKIDIDSMVYSTWTVQEIWCPDSVYRYRIADIDSLGFVDVNTDQVAQNLAHVGAYIIPLYMECNSSFELEERVRSTVMQMDGVEDLWADNQSLFVKIRDYGATAYTYPPTPIAPVIEQTPEPNFLNTRIKEQTSENTIHKHIHKDVKNICFAVQWRDDDKFKEVNHKTDSVKNVLRNFGFNAVVVDKPSTDFFLRDIRDYDMVLLNTHGLYDHSNSTHWLATGEKIYSYKKGDVINMDSLNRLESEHLKKNYYDNNYSPCEVKGMYLEEVRSGDTIVVQYVWISSKLIAKNAEPESNNVLVINGACQSMSGTDDTYKEMAQAFIRTGTDYYMGYTDSNRTHAMTNCGMSLYMANGNSIYNAALMLPDNYRAEDFEDPEGSGHFYHPRLSYWPNDTENDYICITPIETHDIQSVASGNENYILLRGGIKTMNSYDIEEYGFYISETQNPSPDNPNADYYRFGDPSDYYVEDTANNTFEFTKAIDKNDLQPGTTYYYRAVLFDGTSYCLGDVKEFKSSEISENLIEIYVMASQNPHLYVWFNEFGPGPVVEPCGSWPGILMTRKKIINGVTFWYACFDYDEIMIIFNNGFIPEEGQPNYHINQTTEIQLFRGAHFFTYDGGGEYTDISNNFR